MATRVLAAAFLVASALLAWLTINLVLAARALQVGIALSMVYVGYLAWHGWRVMRSASTDPSNRADDGGRPFVSIIVPARDEATIVGGVVTDLLAQTYAGRDGSVAFEVVVIDDGSHDATAAVARAAAGANPLIRVVRREPGTGPATKGAALAFAQPLLRGEIVAAVDADTRLDPEFVEHALRAWRRDPGAAAIQVERRPRNAGRSWLTRAQLEEQLMDMASQCGRWATDGTAELRGNGMFVRRAALESVGGWDPEALTEDLELSTRLAAAGHHVTLAPEVTVREEAVESAGALWRQRLRWAEGSLRRLMEHGPRLLLGAQPIGRKADFLAFTGEFLVPPLFATTIIASLATIPQPRPADWSVPASLFAGYGIGAFMLALAGLAADGRRGLALLGGSVRGALFLSHWLLVVPCALARIAFWPGRSSFVQTPRGTATDR
ncbi:MAG: glycosyltransferase [Candidatus Limnocylindria bacterium]